MLVRTVDPLKVAIWERDDAHPDGELLLSGDSTIVHAVADTPGVRTAIRQGRLVEFAPDAPVETDPPSDPDAPVETAESLDLHDASAPESDPVDPADPASAPPAKAKKTR